MKYRKVRIAWSVAWALVAVLLCALWVRSYAWHDTVIYEEGTRTTAAGWNQGELFFTTSQIPDTLQVKFRKSFRFQHEEPDYEHGFEYTCLGFAFKRAPDVCLLIDSILVCDNCVYRVRRCITNPVVRSFLPPHTVNCDHAGGCGIGRNCLRHARLAG